MEFSIEEICNVGASVGVALQPVFAAIDAALGQGYAERLKFKQVLYGQPATRLKPFSHSVRIMGIPVARSTMHLVNDRAVLLEHHVLPDGIAEVKSRVGEVPHG